MREATGIVERVRRVTPIVVGVVTLALAAGCVHPGPGPVKPTVPPTTLGNRPPPVVVQSRDKTLSLTPFTFCWVRLCADGRPPENPPDIGAANWVTVVFPFEGWTFTAAFEPVGRPPGNGIVVDLARTGTTTHHLVPKVPAGTYTVILMGSGQNRDVVTAFRWTVTGSS